MSEEHAGTEGGLTRGAFVVRAATVVTAVGAATAVGAGAASSPVGTQDRAVLRLLTFLEDVQAAFYTRAARLDLDGELRQFVRVAGAHERTHAAYLRATAGAAIGPPAQIDLGATADDPRRVLVNAVRLEDLATSGFDGQAANLSPALLARVARISSVQARHAAWVRDLAGRDPAPAAIGRLAGEREVQDELRAIGIHWKGAP